MNIEDIYDKENTTTLSIKTVTGKIHVNPKWEEVKLDQPKLVVPQMIFDVIESFDEDVEYLHEHLNHQSDEVREWLTHNERDFYEACLAYPNITVEKEKLYTVEIPNPHEKQLSYVLMRKPGGNISINVVHSSNLVLLKTDNDLQLTEKEIKKDFDWAWQWKKEVTE
ncbi:DUF1642 domain-containing protein [Streptococcus uberis]|nr:DUF1642 domain-containing protein [Streptococcus uberis]